MSRILACILGLMTLATAANLPSKQYLDLKAIKTMVADFIDRVFDGAARPLLVQLIKDRKLTKKELEDLARQIEEA